MKLRWFLFIHFFQATIERPQPGQTWRSETLLTILSERYLNHGHYCPNEDQIRALRSTIKHLHSSAANEIQFANDLHRWKYYFSKIKKFHKYGFFSNMFIGKLLINHESRLRFCQNITSRDFQSWWRFVSKNGLSIARSDLFTKLGSRIFRAVNFSRTFLFKEFKNT